MLRPYRTVLTLLLAVGAAVMTGCASAPALKEEAVAKPLPPVVRPERTVGYKVVQLRDGKQEEVNSLVAQTDEAQTWMSSTGCRAVVSRVGFAPAAEFAKGEWHHLSQTVKLLEGARPGHRLSRRWEVGDISTGHSSRR